MRDFGVLPRRRRTRSCWTSGLQTLPVRMKQHCENAQKVAEFLERSPKVEFGQLPRPAHPATSTKRRRSTCPRAAPASSPSPSRARAKTRRRFIDALQLASTVTHVADIRTLRPAAGQHHPPPALGRRSCARAASPRASSASPWAWRASTTSSPTWPRRWRRSDPNRNKSEALPLGKRLSVSTKSTRFEKMQFAFSRITSAPCALRARPRADKGKRAFGPPPRGVHAAAAD